MSEPKYAPANEWGMKPWLVTIREWGRERTVIYFAESAAAAKYQAVGRSRYVTARARRATPADMEAAWP